MTNPKNWRTHPKPQSEALTAILKEVGFAGALIAFETAEGLQLIDGHLRQKLAPNQVMPVLVLDVTEQEADKLLLTFDPLSAMAEADKTALDSLLREVSTGDAALQAMLAQLAADQGITPPDFEPVGADEQGKLDQQSKALCPKCKTKLVCPQC